MSMGPRLVKLVVAALLAAVILALAASAGLAADNPMVVLIDVDGYDKVSKAEILGAIRATQIGMPLDLNALKTDQQNIFSLGYFVEVPAPEVVKALGGVKVIFHVVEYAPFKALRITGLTMMPVADALTIFAIKPGDLINRNNLARDLRQLFDKARDEFGVLLKSPSQQISPDGVIEIGITEMRLGKLSFSGLGKTKPYVARRVISAKEGEIFDVKTFGKDLQNLFMLGFFESIDTKVTESTEAQDAIDIEVIFKERKTASVMGTVTYSTGTKEWSGGLKLGDTNLFGTGQSLSVSADLNLTKRNFQVDYSNPWIGPAQTSLNVSLYNNYDAQVIAEDTSVPEYVYATESLYGLEIGLGHALSKNATVSVSAKHQVLDREETGPYVPEPGEDLGNPPPVTDGTITTNSLALALEYKDLTPQKAKYVYVSDGIRAKLSTEFAGNFLGGDTDYQRYQLEGNFFKSVSPRDVFALRLTGGFVNVNYDPLQTSYFLNGGAESLRAYDYREFRSTTMLLGNLEYRHRFTDNIEGVIFYDQGQFYSADTDWESASDYGLGFRFWVPYLGQLRLDYAWQVDTGESKFNFSFGELF